LSLAVDQFRRVYAAPEDDDEALPAPTPAAEGARQAGLLLLASAAAELAVAIWFLVLGSSLTWILCASIVLEVGLGVALLKRGRSLRAVGLASLLARHGYSSWVPFTVPWWSWITPTLHVLPFGLLLFGRASRRRNQWALLLGVLGLVGQMGFIGWGVWYRSWLAGGR
jgi:hypothetical protein